jgi:hypothetical protein
MLGCLFMQAGPLQPATRRCRRTGGVHTSISRANGLHQARPPLLLLASSCSVPAVRLCCALVPLTAARFPCTTQYLLSASTQFVAPTRCLRLTPWLSPKLTLRGPGSWLSRALTNPITILRHLCCSSRTFATAWCGRDRRQS